MTEQIKEEIAQVLEGIEGVKAVLPDTPNFLPDLPAITVDHQGDQQRVLTMGSFLVTAFFHIRVYVDMGTNQRDSRDEVERIADEVMSRVRANHRANGRFWMIEERAVDKAANGNSRQAWVHPMVLQVQYQRSVDNG